VVVELHPEALAEDAEAVGFYEQHAPGLGREFFEEVQRVLRLIEENPGIGSPLDGRYRRAYCRRFPFGIVYREGRDVIRVQAVMHLRRTPGYWKDRG
jgi:plasmid stabilization system protein ParE